ERVAPFRDAPLELHLGLQRRLRQIYLHALASRLDVSDVDEPRQRGRPEARERAAARVEREVIARPAIEVAGRHDPGVFPGQVPFLRTREGRLVPGVARVDRVPERV